MPRIESLENTEWSSKSSEVIRHIKSLYFIHSDVLDLIKVIKLIISKCNLTNHNHFDDYQRLSIIYRKCFNGDQDIRRYRLSDKNYKNIKMHD